MTEQADAGQQSVGWKQSGGARPIFAEIKSAFHCRGKRLGGFTMHVNREVTSGEGFGDFDVLHTHLTALVIRTK